MKSGWFILAFLLILLVALVVRAMDHKDTIAQLGRLQEEKEKIGEKVRDLLAEAEEDRLRRQCKAAIPSKEARNLCYAGASVLAKKKAEEEWARIVKRVQQ